MMKRAFVYHLILAAMVVMTVFVTPKRALAESCSSIFLTPKEATYQAAQVQKSLPTQQILFLKGNKFLAKVFRNFAELSSPLLPKNFRVDPVLLDSLEGSEVLLLGRFYKSPTLSIDYIRENYVPEAKILTGKLGFGVNLITNIQNLIRSSKRIVIWDNQIERDSFTYLYEVSYIAQYQELSEKTVVIDDAGNAKSFKNWYRQLAPKNISLWLATQ